MRKTTLLAVWLLCSGFTLELRWNDNSNNEDGFIVMMKGPKGGWQEFARVGRDVTQYFATVDGRQGQKFCFRIVSYFELITAAPSNSRCATINQIDTGP